MKRYIVFIKVVALTLVLSLCMISLISCGLVRGLWELQYAPYEVASGEMSMEDYEYEKEMRDKKKLAPKNLEVTICLLDGTPLEPGAVLFDNTEYIIKASGDGSIESFDFEVSGGSLDGKGYGSRIWTTPDTEGSYSISVNASSDYGKNESTHDVSIGTPESITTLLQPIVLGSFYPGKEEEVREEVSKGPAFIGDSISNTPIWCWYILDFSWFLLYEAWTSESRINDVSITITVTDSFGNPIIGDDPLLYLFEDAIEDLRQELFYESLKNIEDRVKHYHDNAAGTTIKVGGLQDNGSTILDGDLLVDKFNGYLDNGLSKILVVIPGPDESDDNNQVDGFLLDLDFNLGFSLRQGHLYELPPERSTGGVGLILTTDSHGNIIVDGVIEGFPAANAGIQKGYHLLKVGAVDVEGMPLNSVVNLVVGIEGTEIDLIFSDPHAGEEKEVTLERVVLPPEEDILIDDSTKDESTEESTGEEPTEEPPASQDEEICPKCNKPYSECGCTPPDN